MMVNRMIRYFEHKFYLVGWDEVMDLLCKNMKGAKYKIYRQFWIKN